MTGDRLYYKISEEIAIFENTGDSNNDADVINFRKAIARILDEAKAEFPKLHEDDDGHGGLDRYYDTEKIEALQKECTKWEQKYLKTTTEMYEEIQRLRERNQKISEYNKAVIREINGFLSNSAKDWAWYFYEYLGHQVVDGKEDEEALKKSMDDTFNRIKLKYIPSPSALKGEKE